jgi:hypothetical protein
MCSGRYSVLLIIRRVCNHSSLCLNPQKKAAVPLQGSLYSRILSVQDEDTALSAGYHMKWRVNHAFGFFRAYALVTSV